MTRPDISEAVGKVARHVSKPAQVHVIAVKRIIRYIQGTIDYGITFGGSMDKLMVFSDSDWAGDLNNRRSVSGMVIMLYGGVVAYHSRQQKCVATSSSEAEYIAVSEKQLSRQGTSCKNYHAATL